MTLQPLRQFRLIDLLALVALAAVCLAWFRYTWVAPYALIPGRLGIASMGVAIFAAVTYRRGWERAMWNWLTVAALLLVADFVCGMIGSLRVMGGPPTWAWLKAHYADAFWEVVSSTSLPLLFIIGPATSLALTRRTGPSWGCVAALLAALTNLAALVAMFVVFCMP